MKKKLVLSIFILISLLTITGCDKDNETKNTKSKNNTYECRYSKDDNTEGKRYLTKYIIELNNKKELEVYTLITGFSNYGSETDGYKEFCNGLKENQQKDLLEKYKDVVSMKVVCDEKNNYEAYVIKEYKVQKIKDIEELSTIYKSLEPYMKEDGTFDLESWKNYFDTDSLKAGNYSCDF